MSILSEAKTRLLKGEDPLTVFRETKEKVTAWVSGAEAKLPVEARVLLDETASDVKQGLSDLAGAAGDALPGLLVGPTTAIDDAFAATAASYLGPVAGGILSKVQADGLNRIEAALINQVKSAKLTHIAAVTGASAPKVP